MMTLNRRIHKAYQRTRDANFALDGLVGLICLVKLQALSARVKLVSQP